MSEKKKTYAKLVFIILLIFMYQFYGIFPVSDQISQIICFILSITFFLICWNKRIKTKFYFSSTLVFIGIMVTSGLIMTFFNIGFVFNAFIKYINVLGIMTLALSVYVFVTEEWFFTLKSIIYVSTIGNFIMLLQVIYFNYSGFFFLKVPYGFRNGPRFSLGGAILPFVVLLLLSLVITKKHKLTPIFAVNIISGFAAILYAIQTRQVFISLIISVFVMLFFSIISKKNIVLLLILSTCIFFICLFGGSSYINHYINSFTESTGDYAGSSSVRQGELNWYLYTVIPMHFPLGIGLYDNVQWGEITYLAHGPYGSFTTTDIGTIGDIVNFGIFALLAIFSIIRKMIVISIRNPLLIGIATFIIYCQLTTLSYLVLSNSMERFITLMFIIGLMTAIDRIEREGI
ncbi:hypothetical protein [Lactococcus sp. NH2-7C]|uniref:hypothetical protein n=1 Tax=Lactococcus sp. NH2-7C TaxID=2879149 RepID=UPI001CDBD509|nr:hypothetical protein [Lactococcus sp. NH2-7C]MCA2390318.1 hypothetical protein [Lactococcus sp. NH2-7C]WGV29432.1 hypothetical protein QJV49_07775 [Lactococcus sp. NH2-7C]